VGNDLPDYSTATEATIVNKFVQSSYAGNGALARQITTGGKVKFVFIMPRLFEYTAWLLHGTDTSASISMQGALANCADSRTIPHASDGSTLIIHLRL
jgi:hypothetical protein